MFYGHFQSNCISHVVGFPAKRQVDVVLPAIVLLAVGRYLEAGVDVVAELCAQVDAVAESGALSLDIPRGEGNVSMGGVGGDRLDILC